MEYNQTSARYYAGRPANTYQSHGYDGHKDDDSSPPSSLADSPLKDHNIHNSDTHETLRRIASEETQHGLEHTQSVAPPRSFAERARGRSDLQLETATQQSDFSDSVMSHTTAPEDAYDLNETPEMDLNRLSTRRNSVEEKSPLQKLETTLGGISKEEKRARLEDAEQRAVKRASVESGKLVHRKPVPAVETLPSRIESQRTSQHGIQHRNEDDSALIFVPTQKGLLACDAASSQLTSNSSSGPARALSFSTRNRGGGYGHDAALTGGAAAAAVESYQAAKSQWRNTSRDGSRTTQGSITSPTSHPHPTRRASAKRPNDTVRENIGGDDAQQPQTQKQPQHEQKDAHQKIGHKFTEKSTKKEPDLVRREDVERDSDKGPKYEQPPQTKAARATRQAVGFGTVDPNQVAEDKHTEEGHRRIHFSDIIQEFGSHSVRRYQPPPTLEEWTSAETATLRSDDLRLEPREAGWSQSSTDQSKGTRRALAGQGRSLNSQEDSQGASSPDAGFSPTLHLRCGPLLRYNGMSRDAAESKEVWRGSVMIVTDDARSQYDTVPILRFFKQPMDSQPIPQSQIDGDVGEKIISEDIDPLAGQPKMSRTGKTLYVRPVHHLPAKTDLSRIESNDGLFESIASSEHGGGRPPPTRISQQDGEKLGRFREVRGFRLHAERGVTFWRFNIEVELAFEQTRIAYRINHGSPIGFWVPAAGQTMNMMFHSCNGFTMSVKTDEFSGPDPLWRDVLNTHQTTPFHCMLGGGDQIYNDAAMRETKYFQEWLSIKNPAKKHRASFTPEMQEELEKFYLDRYAMWFSQGLFGMATSQIPMVNIWDDHDIIDGFGSYPHHFMATPVFSGLGNIAFKYYMLFQHQSVPDENEKNEPSWLLGASPGPYINQLSRSLFMYMGRNVAFLGLDCRTERMKDEVLCQETYDIVFDRCRREIIEGETKHLIVLLGIPIAYPRLNFAENIFTSKFMEPVKALGRMNLLGNFVNKFDGGVELLDDLDDHWTAKHHKQERNWFIQELQELADEKSVRITILGGDVHLAAIGQFYSNPKLGLPKDRDHRYMPNIISSAIVNTPPPEMMADVLNKRNKVHHLDKETDEDMIAMFPHDVDGSHRKNQHLLARRNWCSIREYQPNVSAPPTPPPKDDPPKRRRNLSLHRNKSLTRHDPQRGILLARASSKREPPSAFRSPGAADLAGIASRTAEQSSRTDGRLHTQDANSSTHDDDRGRQSIHRHESYKYLSGRGGQIDLRDGLAITINCEVDQKDPLGVTSPYRLLVPALQINDDDDRFWQGKRERLTGFLGGLGRNMSRRRQSDAQDEYERSDESEARLSRLPQNATSLDGQNEQDNENEAFPHNQTTVSITNVQPRSKINKQTTTSLQRASTDSDRGQLPSDSVLDRLPRSQAPYEEEAIYRRPSTRSRRNSVQGPPPPANIDDLPISVQKRYSQLNDPIQQRYNDLTAPIPYRDVSQRLLRSSGSGSSREATSPTRRDAFGHGIGSAAWQHEPPSSFSAYGQYRDRRYSSGAMESPLLPAGATQLMSSDKRSNYDPMLQGQQERAGSGLNSGAGQAYGLGQQSRDQGFSTTSYNTNAGVDTNNSNNRRVVSSPPAYSHTHTSQSQQNQQQYPTGPTSSIGTLSNIPVQRLPGPLNFNPPATTSTSRNSSEGARDPYQTTSDLRVQNFQPRTRRPSKLNRHYGDLDSTELRGPWTGPESPEMAGARFSQTAVRGEGNDNGLDTDGDGVYEDGGVAQARRVAGMPDMVARQYDGQEMGSGVRGGTARTNSGRIGIVRSVSEGGSGSGSGEGKKGWRIWSR